MMSMAEVETEDDDETTRQPAPRENLPRFSLRTGVTWSNVDIEPMTEPLATARHIDADQRDEWSAWTSPTTRMTAMPPRSETTVTRPMMRKPERVEVKLPPLPQLPQAPRPKLESGLRLTPERAERKSLPPMPRVPRPSVQSDVPLPRPRPRLASIGLRPLTSVEGPRFERAPAMPTPPMFPSEAAAPPAEEHGDQVEVAPAFRVDPAPLATLPTAAPHVVSAPTSVLDRFEASNHTKPTTLPPMAGVPQRLTVGLPVPQGFQEPPRPLALPARPLPIPWLGNTQANRVLSSPFFLLAFAVSLVAMSVLGFTAVASSVSESRRAARTRVVTASDIGGANISEAVVFVDGSPSCTGLPCSIELEEGAHWITVRAAGYDTPPSRAVRTGNSEPNNVHFGLTRPSSIPLPSYAPASVATAPAVTATAAPVAPAPSPLATVPHYAPAIVAIAPPTSSPPVAVSEPVATPVAAAPVAVAPVALAQPADAARSSTLNINSLPVSNIVLDGRPLGQTPKLRVKVKPGNHSVVFIRNGKRVTRGARVGIGESVTVSARL